jgi:hypothetical protein
MKLETTTATRAPRPANDNARPSLEDFLGPETLAAVQRAGDKYQARQARIRSLAEVSHEEN